MYEKLSTSYDSIACKTTVESEVKWALESMANNKVSGGDGIPVELFKIF